MKPIELIRKTLGQAIEHEGIDGFSGVYRTRGEEFKFVFSYGGGWEHASISVLFKKRCPIWAEMCMFKDIFWKSDETVIQYHPAEEDYINYHDYCLHLWRPCNGNIPTPPQIYV